MGNRRLGRKRLYTIEKAGATVDPGAGEGAAPMIARTTQHRVGQELVTEIVLDLGTSKGTITSGGAAGKASGVTGKAAHLTQLTIAKYGIITEIRTVCTEAPSISSTGKGVNITLGSTTENTGDAIAGAVDVNNASTPLDGVGEDRSLEIDNASTYQGSGSEFYLYVSADDSDAGNYDAGKITIYIYGFAVPDDL
tara:strand:+ start:836 stop:1420 length:585 start_codon:yes stop_codon:yes gene_type:complete